MKFLQIPLIKKYACINPMAAFRELVTMLPSSGVCDLHGQRRKPDVLQPELGETDANKNNKQQELPKFVRYLLIRTRKGPSLGMGMGCRFLITML